MKKMVIICAGNTILFTLLGLTFLYPFSEVSQDQFGFSATLTLFPFLLAAFLIIYPAVYYVLARKNQWKKIDNSELAYLDEREKVVVSEATKAVYKVLIGGLIVIVPLIGGLRFFSLFTHIEISTYFITIALLTALLDLAMILYCVKWCLEYKK